MLLTCLESDTSYDKNESNGACKNKLNTRTKPYPDSINDRQSFRVPLKKNNNSAIEAQALKTSQKNTITTC